MRIKIVWFTEKTVPEFVAMAQKEGWLIDEFELVNTIRRFPTASFAAFVDGKLAGGITVYFHEKSAWIGNFLVFDEYIYTLIFQFTYYACAKIYNLFVFVRKSFVLHAF